MTNKQKAAILSVIASSILSMILWFMILIHIQATPVIWLMFWFSAIFSGIVTCLLKYVFEVT